MPLTSFCGLLTLQVGAAILSAVFFTLAAVILSANLFDYHNTNDGWPVSLILMIIFVIGLIIIGLMTFASSYIENRSLALGSVIVIIIVLCYWIILCCFSFVSNPQHINSICISTRCPESFWLANLGYRRQHYNETQHDTSEHTKSTSRRRRSIYRFGGDSYSLGRLLERGEDFNQEAASYYTNDKLKEDHNKTDPNIHKQGSTHNKTGLSVSPATKVKGLNSLLQTKRRHYFLENTNNSTKNEDGREVEESRYVYGFPLVGAVILFVANLIFLLFSAFVMWSWASELDWADYYIEDEPVVILEETY